MAQFYYDGLGRLRERVDYTGASRTETHYIYDGWRVIQERDSNNVPQVSYTRGIDLSGSLEGAGGIGGLLARSSGYSSGNWTSHAYYHADGNGNITCLVDTNQAVVASYRYDPFGNTISKSGTLAAANLYRFSSKEIHVNSGMYYYGYRFYDPSLQRWINRDPIFEVGGANLYTHVGNRPVCAVDPFGLEVTGVDVGLTIACATVCSEMGLLGPVAFAACVSSCVYLLEHPNKIPLPRHPPHDPNWPAPVCENRPPPFVTGPPLPPPPPPSRPPPQLWPAKPNPQPYPIPDPGPPVVFFWGQVP